MRLSQLVCISIEPIAFQLSLLDVLSNLGSAHVHVNGGRLDIIRGREQDSGVYHCDAENEVGHLVSSTWLQVSGMLTKTVCFIKLQCCTTVVLKQSKKKKANQSYRKFPFSFSYSLEHKSTYWLQSSCF